VPIQVYARDPAGNEAVAPMDHKVFPKAYVKSRIDIDDKFLGRVVPAIAANSPGEKIATDDLLAGFLKINGDLRKKNNQYLMDLAKQSSPEMYFKDAFQQLGNSQVEARFADTRTYVIGARTSISRCISASTSRRRQTSRSSRRNEARSCTRPTSASTATAS
jgi:hypothetical protein